MMVFLNSRFVSAKDAKVSVFDHGFLYGDGIYETLRSFGGRVWNVDVHLDRLFLSAKLLNLPLPWARKQLARLVQECVKRNRLQDGRIRITVTRGQNNFVFRGSRKPTLLIHTEHFSAYPHVFYKNGIDVVTWRGQRPFPAVKSISLMSAIEAQHYMHTKSAHEALFIDRNEHITEGTMSNAACVKSGKLLVPRGDILKGTTLVLVEKLARKNGIQVKHVAISKRALYAMDECFITSVTRGIMPVRSVDGRKMGDGVPGPITKQLMTLWNALIAEFRNARI